MSGIYTLHYHLAHRQGTDTDPQLHEDAAMSVLPPHLYDSPALAAVWTAMNRIGAWKVRRLH